MGLSVAFLVGLYDKAEILVWNYSSTNVTMKGDLQLNLWYSRPDLDTNVCRFIGSVSTAQIEYSQEWSD